MRVASTFESLDHPHFRLPLFKLGAVQPPLSDSVVVDVTIGPDTDRFGGELDHLYDQWFTVSPQSNHIGLRLVGPPRNHRYARRSCLVASRWARSRSRPRAGSSHCCAADR